APAPAPPVPRRAGLHSPAPPGAQSTAGNPRRVRDAPRTGRGAPPAPAVPGPHPARRARARWRLRPAVRGSTTAGPLEVQTSGYARPPPGRAVRGSATAGPLEALARGRLAACSYSQPTWTLAGADTDHTYKMARAVLCAAAVPPDAADLTGTQAHDPTGLELSPSRSGYSELVARATSAGRAPTSLKLSPSRTLV